MTTRAALLLVLAIIGFTLAGCGLSPVYGKYANGGQSSPVAAALDGVYIDSIPNRTGQKLRNLLMDRMYQHGRVSHANAAYRLSVSGVGETIYGIGIAKDATATRSQIVLSTVITLTRAGDPERVPLVTRTLKAISSFNTLASQYTTLVTEEDARNQAIEDLSDQIVTQLELYFSNPSAFPPPEEPKDIQDLNHARTDAQKRIDNQRFYIDQ